MNCGWLAGYRLMVKVSAPMLLPRMMSVMVMMFSNVPPEQPATTPCSTYTWPSLTLSVRWGMGYFSSIMPRASFSTLASSSCAFSRNSRMV